MEEWEAASSAPDFNAVREFNAHYATFADRLELLDTLASIEQSWKPKLKQAVEIFRQERESRIDDCAEVITESRSSTRRRAALRRCQRRQPDAIRSGCSGQN